MIKKIKLPLIVLVCICAVYVISSTVYSYYASENDNITYLGENYTKINIGSVDFIPFSECNGSFDESDSINLFGLSFDKKNGERNYVRLNSLFFGDKLFKKDSYNPPIDPLSENVDKIIIVDSSTEKEAVITDRNDINTLVTYFSSINGKVAVVGVAEQDEQDVYVYAVSYKDGGLFNLTGLDRTPVRNENNELFIEDMLGAVYLPKDVTSIINNSLIL